MLVILGNCNEFQVFESVIGLDSIFVIDGKEFSRCGYDGFRFREGAGNDSVCEEPVLLFIFDKADLAIADAIKFALEFLWSAQGIAFESAEVRHHVRIEPRDFLPDLTFD